MRIRIKRRRKFSARAIRRWAAVGALAAHGVIGGRIGSAVAQILPPPHAVQRPQAPTTARQFDIPAGAMGEMLVGFEAATAIHARFARAGLEKLLSPGVSGLYSPEQALERLLADTGLAFRFVSPSDVVVDLKRVAESVDVITSVEALAESPKYAQGQLETPQTVTEVTRRTIDEQGVTTLRDALRNVAGISLAAGEGGAQGDNLTIRGFTARNDLFIDGMRDFGSYYRDPFNVEAVDVLQGASSVTFGRGSTGGVVNQASKAPRADRFLSFAADLGTDQTRRGTLDLNAPLPRLRLGLGGDTAFRLNLMGNENGVAGRDVARNRRWGVAPSLAFGLGTPTRLTLSYLHLSADDTPDYGVPWLFNQPAPVARTNYYGFADSNYLRTAADVGSVRMDRDFNAHFSFRNQARWASYDRSVLISEARLAGAVTPSTPIDAIQVTRNQINVSSAEGYLADQLDVTGRFRTWFADHQLAGGLEGSRETSSPSRGTWSGVPGTSLVNPDPSQRFAGTFAQTSSVRAMSVTGAVYVLDTIRLTSKLQLAGGLRLERFDSDYSQNVAPRASYSHLDRMASWRAAATYKPARTGTIYVAAGTSYNPSAESLSLSSTNQYLPPEKNVSYEAGTKWDLSRFSLRAALFRTEKQNARETDPENSANVVMSGNQRADGVQVEFHGSITRRWDLQTSYAHLNARVTLSRFYPLAVGARLANVPADTYNFWSTYQLPRRWQFGFGGNYVGARTASSTTPYDATTGLVKQAPGYWVFNLMATRRLNEHVELQANVKNLTDRYYYDLLHPSHIVPGAARSAWMGIKFRF